MKNSMRKAMISTVCMLIVAVMSLTGVTYAWFSQGTSGQVTGMEMTVTSAAGGVQISADLGQSWGNIVPVSTNVTDAAPVSTVGGAGEWAFFTGTINPENSTQIKSAAAAASNYVKQEIWLKNDGAKGITIALAGIAGTADADITTTITEDDTTYNGHLAARLGIRKKGAEKTAQAPHDWSAGARVNGENGFGIFEPNATTHLNGTGSVLTYKGVKAASGDTYFPIAGDENNTYTPADVTTTITDPIAFEIYIPAQSIIKLEVFVWLEGQDADCTNAVSSSKLKVDLRFVVTATDAEAATVPEPDPELDPAE